jgi:hypothetical protein
MYLHDGESVKIPRKVFCPLATHEIDEPSPPRRQDTHHSSVDSLTIRPIWPYIDVLRIDETLQHMMSLAFLAGKSGGVDEPVGEKNVSGWTDRARGPSERGYQMT